VLIVLSYVRVTIDEVLIGNRIYWTLKHKIRYTALQMTIRDECSQSRFSLLCLVMSSNIGRSSAPGLTSSQACDHLTPISYSSNCRLRTLSRLTGNGSWSSLYRLGTNLTENTACSSSCIVACVSIAAIKWRLLSHCLETDVFKEPFPSNICLFWLHNSGFQQTCHSIFKK
jgi:hypothetical protein